MTDPDQPRDLIFAGGTPPGRYGPFHRTGSTQDDQTTARQLRTGELWGRADRWSDMPSVDAYTGPLPGWRSHGVEFWTDVEPSPGTRSALARWLGPRPGVEIDGEWAKIRGRITRARLQR